jgi:hypothetical protein
MRLRSDTQLGPRTTVDITDTRRAGLEDPDEFWVELSAYTEEYPNEEVKPDMITYEPDHNGKMTPGAHWFGLALHDLLHVVYHSQCYSMTRCICGFYTH